jgi:hypothetical protein
MAVLKNDAISRREMLQAIGAGSAVVLGAQMAGAAEVGPPSRPSRQKSALSLKHPPLDKVRVGIIGMGGRGTGLLGELLGIDGVAITAVCDIVPQRTAAAQAQVTAKGRPSPVGYSKNEHDLAEAARDEAQRQPLPHPRPRPRSAVHGHPWRGPVRLSRVHEFVPAVAQPSARRPAGRRPTAPRNLRLRRHEHHAVLFSTSEVRICLDS